MRDPLFEHLEGWPPEKGVEAVSLGDDFIRKVLARASAHRLLRDCLVMLISGAAALIPALIWKRTNARGGHPKTTGGTTA